MTASLTTFGVILIPLVIGIALFRKQWLLPALVVTSTLQAPSVLNVGFGQNVATYGLTSFSLVAVVIALLLGTQGRQLEYKGLFSSRAGFNLRLWLIYAAIAIIGSFLLPLLFRDTPVYLLMNRDSFEAGIAPLRWTLSNLAQAGNLTLLVLLLIYIRLQRNDPQLPSRILIGFGVALVLSALIGLQQRLAWQQVVPMMEAFWTSNPAYAQNFVSYVGPIARVSWPFTEPAYGSAWYAAMFGGCLAVFFAGRNTSLALVGMLIAAFALLNSLGATGIMAIAIFGAIGAILLALFYAKYSLLRWTIAYRAALAALALSCCLLAIHIVLRHYGLLPNARTAMSDFLVGNNPTVWGDIRPETNAHALNSLTDSLGLGLGLGSNRASSYFASLFSNTGIMGGTAFILALGGLWLGLLNSIRQGQHRSASIFLLGANIGGTIAVGLSIPDQNWPGYWIFILASYAVVSSADKVCVNEEEADLSLNARAA